LNFEVHPLSWSFSEPPVLHREYLMSLPSSHYRASL
jgi:hypothetical protein